MKVFKDKKWLFIILMIIDTLAGISNFMEPANVFVAVSIVLSLMVILLGSEMATLYLMIALCPFYNSLNFSGLAAGFVIPIFALMKIPKSNRVQNFWGVSIFLFFLILFLHDIQYQTFAKTVFALLVPLYVFIYIMRNKFSGYDGYYAMWLVICSSLIAMSCIFIVQGADLDSFIYASHAGEMRLGEADTADGQKNQLGGAMGFPIYTITIITLFIQLLMTRHYNAIKKGAIIIVGFSLFFITFLTVSRVYILGLTTLLLLLVLHILHGRSVKSMIFLAVALFIILMISANYLSDYIDQILNQYMGRMDYDGDNSGTGIRGTIYADCIDYLSNNIECLLIGKGNRAYPLIGAMLNRPMSMSAHNIIIDALMSFGVIGTIFLIVIYKSVYNKEHRRIGIRWSFFRIIPLTCVFVMYQTGSPFLQDKTYPFLLFLVLNIIHCTDNSKYDNANKSINFKKTI